MKRKAIAMTVILSALVVGLIGAKQTLAQALDGQDPMATLVEKISQKFGLNQEEVRAVFDQHRAQHQEEMETKRAQHHAEMINRREERLSQAVSDGELTQAQKELILAKIKEIESERINQRDIFLEMTAQERKTTMDAQRTALEVWADENGIQMQYLMFVGREGRGRGGFGEAGLGGKLGPVNDQAEAAEETE